MEAVRFDLNGKTAIVTGAGSGIGRACALALAANGANVVVASRRQPEIDQVAGEIESAGRKSLAVATDVTRKDEVDALVARTVDELGSIDILVNNAGVIVAKPLAPLKDWSPPMAELVPGFDAGYSDEDWYRVIETNVTGVYRCCQAVAPHMMARKRGRIINIGSIDADHGLAFAAPYCASKGAVKSLTKALAKEWVRYNITVNCVAPGYTDTGLFPAFVGNDELKSAVAKQNVPMRRFATPEEIATPVIYLASDEASYVTGESIVIDGGVLA